MIRGFLESLRDAVKRLHRLLLAVLPRADILLQKLLVGFEHVADVVGSASRGGLMFAAKPREFGQQFLAFDTKGLRHLPGEAGEDRSEEHMSELQSLTNIVSRLLL